MPTNRNALIRYKTINDCLSTGRGYSIDELINACSDALAEYCGKYDRISERTVRDDIRTMRSDILGFNAPIILKNGFYFYSNHNYSLRNKLITDVDLIEKMIKFLINLRKKGTDPEIDSLLNRLQRVRIRTTSGPMGKEAGFDFEKPEGRIPGLLTFETRDRIVLKDPEWGDIFRIILKA